MMAMQNHRYWIDEFADALKHADIARLTDIEKNPCRFERWYQGSGSNHYGALKEFDAVGQSHARMHTLASTLMALAERGEVESARERLPSLFAARDELIERLGTLIGQLKTANE